MKLCPRGKKKRAKEEEEDFEEEKCDEKRESFFSFLLFSSFFSLSSSFHRLPLLYSFFRAALFAAQNLSRERENTVSEKKARSGL